MYQPKGYGVELAECLLYFERLNPDDVINIFPGYVTGSTTECRICIEYSKKRVKPTISFNESQSGLVNNGAYPPLSSYSVNAGLISCTFAFKTSGLAQRTPVSFYTTTPIVVSADL
jgi:hypothetical protein